MLSTLQHCETISSKNHCLTTSSDLLLKALRYSVSPCPWYGLMHPKFCTITLFSGFYREFRSRSQISFYEAETWCHCWFNVSEESDKKVNSHLWHGLRHLKSHVRIQVLGFHHEPRHAKSASVKMKLGVIIHLMLLNKQRKKLIHIHDMDWDILDSTWAP